VGLIKWYRNAKIVILPSDVAGLRTSGMLSEIYNTNTMQYNECTMVTRYCPLAYYI